MSCPTATKWLVPNREYLAAESDYAIFNASRKLIRREIDEGNKTHQHNLPDGSPRPVYFDELIGGRLPSDWCYDFVTPCRILWADVDDSRPEHEKTVRDALVKDDPVENLTNEGYAALRDEEINLILKDQIRRSKRYFDTDEEEQKVDAEGSDGESDINDVIVTKKVKISQKEKAHMCQSIAHGLSRHTHAGYMDPKLLNILLSHFNEPERKEQITGLTTAQAFDEKKRPIIILAGMVDNMQTPIRGEKKGWAIGYDIMGDVFICKPFLSDEEHHPLTSSWYGAVADDGISFKATPKEVVEKYLKLGQTLAIKLESGEIKKLAPTGSGGEEEEEENLVPDLELPDINFAFQMAVHVVTARFILTHWAGFVGSHSDHFTEDTSELFAKVKKTHKKIKEALAKIRVPVVAKVEKTDKKLCVCAIEEMEWQLEEQEDYFRKCAVMAKEQGHEKVADNTAKLYEKVMDMVRSFNENPEREI